MKPSENPSLVIMQSGGPTAVINATLYGIVDEARRTNKFSQIWGANGGFEGLRNGTWLNFETFTDATLQAMRNYPGIALKSSRTAVDDEAISQVLRLFKERSVQHLLVVGGNGSMLTPLRLFRAAEQERCDLFVLGVPKTVDNDLVLTDHSPGYGSAARFIARAVQDAIWDLNALPGESVRILEVMGRNTGWLAAASLLVGQLEGGAPDYVLTPEQPFDEEKLLLQLEADLRQDKKVFIVASEGLRTPTGEFVAERSGFIMKDKLGRPNPGFTSGVGHVLAQLIHTRLGCRVRYDKPGVLQRSGLAVSTTDRDEAELIGREALLALLRGESGKMIGFIRNERPYSVRTALFPLEEIAGLERLMPPEFFQRGELDLAMVRSYIGPLIGKPLTKYEMLI
jgi:ATP-dependent phosphofructokinase / diphosphate-dependent phosphofructokinase